MRPSRTLKFREQARAERPADYSGALHLGLTTVACLVAALTPLFFIEDLRALELLTVPVTFLGANLAEYLVHKGPMHRRTRGIEQLFTNHVAGHHTFFTAELMGGDDVDDLYHTLFSLRLFIFFVLVFAIPMGGALYVLFSANCTLLFLATAFFYFLNYEWLHFAYHSPEDSKLRRIPFVDRLAHHHAVHHDLGSMTEWNFNISYPIFDWLFGTTKRSDVEQVDGEADPLLHRRSGDLGVDRR